MRLLINMHGGYGLGDAVMFSPVLRHLQKHRRNWIVDFLCDPGREATARGLCRNVFTKDTNASLTYDREITIALYDTLCGWSDRPNTRVSSVLHEYFGMAWDKSCGSYWVDIHNNVFSEVERWIQNRQCVAIHYEGDSAKERKNLTHEQIRPIIEEIKKFGYTPIILDWRNSSPLVDGVTVFSPGRLSVGEQWARSAEHNAAIIEECHAFIGIDSGPGKCASATFTPSLICWTGNHPAMYHDPARNTKHLIPADHARLIDHNAGALSFFRDNYDFETYQNDLPTKAISWLKRVLP